MAAGNPATLVTSDAPDDYTWTILPLGDSITEGFQGDKGGYRVPLFETVTHHGRRLRFVGRLADTPPDPVINGVPFTPSHEGHSGNHIDEIASLVPGVLSAGPDIILLMIGSNDVLDSCPRHRTIVDKAPDRLDALLGKIIDSQVGALIVVAQIPPIPSISNLVDAYNKGVVDVVRRRIDAGERVLLASMHSGFPLSFLSANDGIHPNQQGYDHIAAVWYAVIDTILT
jgi:lysophospholipase L1-like esterase